MDSNHRPAAYKTAALTAELYARVGADPEKTLVTYQFS